MELISGQFSDSYYPIMDGVAFVARNYAYKPIAIKAEKEKLSLGQFVEVKIIDAKPTCLVGKAV